MKSKIPDKVYRQRAAKLSKYGFDLKANKRIKPAQKGAITKLWKAKKFYITNQDKNRMEFVRVRSVSGLRTARRVISSSQMTPKGFFMQRPKGLKKGSLKYSIRDGSLEIIAKKRMHDLVIPISVVQILKDPIEAQRKALQGRKKPRQTRLMVNGFAGKTAYGIEDFFNYMKDELIPYLKGGTYRHRTRGVLKSNRRMSNAEIEDIFHLRLIY